MDNCDLEKLSVDGVQLCPEFRPEVTLYTAAVPSSVRRVRLHMTTSDCAASCKILSGDRTGTVQLEDGLNRIDVEVIAEDGTAKTYSIQLTKLSASAARLTELTVEGHQLQPGFTPDLYEYCCSVSFDCLRVSVGAQVPDPCMQITVREACSSGSVSLNAGDTLIPVQVTSPDGANSQVYTVMVTREQIPVAVSFCDVRDQMAFECPVSLNALYRPVSINQR
ncbi:uncharacterized protein LOC103036570 [Astyanax mexicanus]|uniref:uncharacterized protein LOC103036570 n=1 Tax=Astyanax mexicanus TaxID=7994 RepID=UPI0020CB4B27|nr:uncharacterized protein LOC103036570 [Astyanax mexicanus]